MVQASYRYPISKSRLVHVLSWHNLWACIQGNIYIRLVVNLSGQSMWPSCLLFQSGSLGNTERGPAGSWSGHWWWAIRRSLSVWEHTAALAWKREASSQLCNTTSYVISAVVSKTVYNRRTIGNVVGCVTAHLQEVVLKEQKFIILLNLYTVFL